MFYFINTGANMTYSLFFKEFSALGFLFVSGYLLSVVA